LGLVLLFIFKILFCKKAFQTPKQKSYVSNVFDKGFDFEHTVGVLNSCVHPVMLLLLANAEL
jgi:hypothetical protein